MMGLVQTFMRRRSAGRLDDHHIDAGAISNASRIIFSVLCRFGDACIASTVIKEFILQYPGKEYLIITRRHLLPIVTEIVPQKSGVSVVCAKWRNPFSLVLALVKILRFKPDVGMNPYSIGEDSDFYISLAKTYSFYRNYANNNREKKRQASHYNFARAYMQLTQEVPHFYRRLDLTTINPVEILFFPESSETKRSISRDNCFRIIEHLRHAYPNCHIRLFSTTTSYQDIPVRHTAIRKSSTSLVVESIKSSDLVVCPDAGPLHIASTFCIPTISFWSCSLPHLVLPEYADSYCVRSEKIRGLACEIKPCENPACIDDAIANLNLLAECPTDNLSAGCVMELQNCPFRQEVSMG